MSAGLRLHRSWLPLPLAAMAVAAPAPAAAEPPRIQMPRNVSAVLDLRMVGADGERSWIDGGFGKARFGADNADFDLEPVLAEASLAWQPPITWNLSGHVAIAAQHGQDQAADLIEAFVSWRPAPRSATRFSARAGLFWPAVSLEHEGAAWAVSDMITPSAINSWIGEEVKVIGIEGTASRDLGGSELAATLGVFGFNDTAGTLLSFRGWALHDQKSGAFSRQKLPPLNGFIRDRQPPWTTPTVEIDGRPGYYAGLRLRMAAPVTLNAFYYHNRADPTAVTSSLQWGWDTRFLNIGARADLGERTRILAQGMAGTTEMGPRPNGRHWVETRFRSAYLRLTHETGRARLSGRLDAFDTRETGARMEAIESEQGWAVTGAVDWRLSPQAELLFEVLHIDSDCGARERLGAAPRQEQAVAQAGIRLTL